eukprot:CAMPEP_0201583572 /NCGR_PEP_ID=MMETSP0190_2-20130828/100012_1 /ASSEMBLY_ACC=CAM_ASM_000263 /TAXON_ID=37353 /ORGANISM="Rosalina sp." /LENGTH=493 /DNA_ID=CAMNT_0048025703 /DNA_START=23 /DNA_END=1504 /DNA_ORIENTATION=-
MAVNALTIRNGIPVPVQREQFLHMDEGLSIEIGNNKNYKGKGKVYLTNYRLIFLKRDPSRQFSSFSLPYLYIKKHKYNKKLMGGPIISGSTKTIMNGGLNGSDECKFQIQFNDTNTGKAFFNLLEKELNKLNSMSQNDNMSKYKRVTNTPSLPIEQIFPDQFAAYQQQQRAKKMATQKNVVISNGNNLNNPARQQVIVGQSPDDAPMQLTPDYRAQPAKLFKSNPSQKNIDDNHNGIKSGLAGASPVNINAFSKHRIGKTVIQDETNKWNNGNDINQHNQRQQHQNYNKDSMAAAPAQQQQQYNAYVDPSNPDDIVLSLPINDNQFNEDEGKANDYNYDIAQKYDEAHNNNNSNNNNGNVVAVSINEHDDEDDDDFSERPKVQPAGIGIAPPPKANDKKSKPRRKNLNNDNHSNGNKKTHINEKEYDLLSQGSDSVFSNESPSPLNGSKAPKKQNNDINDWFDQLPSSNDALLNDKMNGNVNNNPNPWQQFQD